MIRAIVPVAISGSHRVMTKGQATIRSGAVRITFYEPVKTAGYSIEDILAFQTRVRQAILLGLEQKERLVEESQPVRAGVLPGMR